MGFINEALLYLSHVPQESKCFIALRLDRHARREETLAQYYFRTYKHLMGTVHIFEIDVITGEIPREPFAVELQLPNIQGSKTRAPQNALWC